MTSPAVTAALAPLRDMLATDGYDLTLHDHGGTLLVRISAHSDACEDCLVPKNIMTSHIERGLRESLLTVPPIRLLYPADAEA